MLCASPGPPYAGEKPEGKNEDASEARYDNRETGGEIEIADSTENCVFSCFTLISKLCPVIKIKFPPYEVNTWRDYFSPLSLESQRHWKFLFKSLIDTPPPSLS